MRFIELAVVLLESRIAHKRLYEIATDRQCRSASLSESTRTEVYASVFAAYPCAANYIRTDTHKPRIGMIIRCSGLSAEIRITCRVGICPQALRCSSRLTHTSHQQLLHEERALVWYSLLFFHRSRINLLAVLVDDSCYQNRLHVLTVVCHAAIGINHIKQLHVGRAECQ